MRNKLSPYYSLLNETLEDEDVGDVSNFLIPKRYEKKYIEDWVSSLLGADLSLTATLGLLDYYMEYPEEIPEGYVTPEYLSGYYDAIRSSIIQAFQAGEYPSIQENIDVAEEEETKVGDVSSFPVPTTPISLVEQVRQIIRDLTNNQLKFITKEDNSESEGGVILKFSDGIPNHDISFILGGETNEDNPYPNIFQIWEVSDDRLTDEIEMHGTIFGLPLGYSTRKKSQFPQLKKILQKYLSRPILREGVEFEEAISDSEEDLGNVSDFPAPSYSAKDIEAIVAAVLSIQNSKYEYRNLEIDDEDEREYMKQRLQNDIDYETDVLASKYGLSEDDAIEVYNKYASFLDFKEKTKSRLKKDDPKFMKALYDVYLKNTRYSLKDLSGFPEGLDLENCDIISIGDDYVQFEAGGDWQNPVSFSFVVDIKGNPRISDLYDSIRKTSKKDISAYIKQVKEFIEVNKKESKVTYRDVLLETRQYENAAEPTLGDVRAGRANILTDPLESEIGEENVSIPPPVEEDLESSDVAIDSNLSSEEQQIITLYQQYLPQLGHNESLDRVSRELQFPYAAVSMIISACMRNEEENE